MTLALLPLARTRLRPGPFLDAQRRAGVYLQQLDADRLLAPYLREAGLPHAEPYGNWESDGLDGHIGGHYLSAVSQFFAATGDETYRERAEYVVAGLRRAQLAGGTGYIGGIPNSAAFWREVAGGITPETFAGRWVPWYNLHKMLAGLVDADRYARIDGALEAALAFCDWWQGIAANLDDDAFQTMLDTEFGGMGETFADLAERAGLADPTRRADLLAMSTRFVHTSFAAPLSAGRDDLSGLHANTQIPKVLGFHALHRQCPDDALDAAVQTFWRAVVDTRSVAIGGNSVREHFHDVDDFRVMVEDREGPESCNSYNMVRLGLALYEHEHEHEHERDHDPRALDTVERILWNHVLSAQHPEHGGFVYFTPMRPGHYRVYSEPETSMWCCVGTALEAHARHAVAVFAAQDGGILVNLLIAAEVELADGVVLALDGSTPERATLTVQADGPVVLRVGVRVPPWSSATTLRIDGQDAPASRDGDYLHIDRTWRPGDALEIVHTPVISAERLPDGSAWVAYRRGPVVLAARQSSAAMPDLRAGDGRVAHIARGALEPLANTPIVSGLAGDVTETADGLVLRTDRGAVPLESFAALHDARYSVYFPVHDGDPARRRRELEERDAAALGLDARTVDRVVFGEQQPEADHGFDGAASRSGRTDGLSWRSTATAMSVRLLDWLRIARTLRVEVLGDAATAGYDIIVNGRELVASAHSIEGGVNVFEFPLEESDDGWHHVHVIARDGDDGVRVHGVRVLQ